MACLGLLRAIAGCLKQIDPPTCSAGRSYWIRTPLQTRTRNSSKEGAMTSAREEPTGGIVVGIDGSDSSIAASTGP